METVKRTERGWAGHFVCASKCRFRRNTLLEYKDIKIVVSTVGAMYNVDGINSSDFPQEIGWNRYYETLAFHAKFDGVYWDADFEREVNFDLPRYLYNCRCRTDLGANNMHEAVVDDITDKLLKGEII